MSKVYNKRCIKPLGIELIQAKGTVYFSRYFTLSINFFSKFSAKYQHFVSSSEDKKKYTKQSRCNQNQTNKIFIGGGGNNPLLVCFEIVIVLSGEICLILYLMS
jgi:hypothetical protein